MDQHQWAALAFTMDWGRGPGIKANPAGSICPAEPCASAAGAPACPCSLQDCCCVSTSNCLAAAKAQHWPEAPVLVLFPSLLQMGQAINLAWNSHNKHPNKFYFRLLAQTNTRLQLTWHSTSSRSEHRTFRCIAGADSQMQSGVWKSRKVSTCIQKTITIFIFRH